MGFDLIGSVDIYGLLNLVEAILKVGAGLGFVIFVHELGHFLVAKACGVKCEKFYIGFDIPMPWGIPSRLCRFQWGETEYGIGILPLGGYVKMLGQDDNPMNAEKEAQRTLVSATDVPAGPSTDLAVPVVATSNASASRSVDPRSYTAKTVGQRMLIISAGVVMNLIFAVIFAALAFRSGVPFVPCEISQVIPGGPAWKAGVEPQRRIIQIGEDGKKRETLRFDFDLRQSVQTNGDKNDLALLIRDANQSEKWAKVRPFTIREGLESASTIGIGFTMTTTLAEIESAEDIEENSAASAANPPLQARDKIIAVDGITIATEFELRQHLIRHADKEVTLRVERKAKPPATTTETLDIKLPPQRLLDLGVIMEYGGINAIRPNSPADKAGFREGDVIVAINDQPLVDPMFLPDVLRPFYDQEITVTVRRTGETSPVAIRVTPEVPQAHSWSLMFGCPMASDALGVSYDVTRKVKSVVSNSPAAKAGMQPGDEVTAVQIAWDKANSTRKKRRVQGDVLKLDDRQFMWPDFYTHLQHRIPGEVVLLTYLRNGKTAIGELQPMEIEAFNTDRGLVFEEYNEIHQARSWGEAFQLGARQTWEDAFRVVGILKKLVTGQVSVANLGGIGSIAYVAKREADQGTTRLLIFLTMLSANLAVLNFLPIPALDGGHMMLLAYEGIFRRPVNERLQVALTIAGVVCLLGLMIFVNAMDIKRFFF